MRHVDPAALMSQEQDFKWRRALCLQWCSLEGIDGSSMQSGTVNDDGSVTIVEYVRHPLGGLQFDADRKEPLVHTRTITPRIPPPWLEWE